MGTREACGGRNSGGGRSARRGWELKCNDGTNCVEAHFLRQTTSACVSAGELIACWSWHGAALLSPSVRSSLARAREGWRRPDGDRHASY
jgi:hypothetical protein